MYDNVRSVDQDPAAVTIAFDMIRTHAVLCQSVTHIVSNSVCLPLIASADDHHLINTGIQLSEFINQDIFSFFSSMAFNIISSFSFIGLLSPFSDMHSVPDEHVQTLLSGSLCIMRSVRLYRNFFPAPAYLRRK